MDDEDLRVQLLSESGALQQVVGSQSILSQELPEESESQEEEEEEVVTAAAGGLAHADRPPPPASSTTTTVRQVAHRYGLVLSQEQQQQQCSSDEVDDDDDDDGMSASVTDSRRESNMSQLALSQETMNLATTANLSSLLDAVQQVTEKEEKQRSHCQRKASTRRRGSNDRPATRTTRSKTKRVVHPLLEEEEQQQSPPDDDYEKKPKRRRKSTAPQKTATTKKTHTTSNEKATTGPDQTIARKAADLAARAINEPELAKRLLLSMALTRTNPRTPVRNLPPAGTIIGDGFVWTHYPPLEQVLRAHMSEYYRLSTAHCQSAAQQQFNNDLVAFVKDAAAAHHWTFCPRTYTTHNPRVLRNRIRCYYKTHIQNAKKRLRTMLRNPCKRANAIHLTQHYEMLLENTNSSAAVVVMAEESSSFGSSSLEQEEEEDSSDEKKKRQGKRRSVS